MFTNLLNSKLVRILGILMLIIPLGAGFLTPLSTAYAQDEFPPKETEADTVEKWSNRLSWIYQRELNVLDAQQLRLDNTKNTINRIEVWIERASDNGRDPAALQSALQDFQAGVAKAQEAHTEAARILGSHTGFDENGNVIDIKEAEHTINTARKSLTEAHRNLEQAARRLRLEIRRWLKDQFLQQNTNQL